MSFFANILSRFNKKDMVLTPELQKLKEFEVMIRSLLSADKYVARKDYTWLRDGYKDIYITFSQLVSTGMLNAYCETNHVEPARITQFLNQYSQIAEPDSQLFAKHNERFMEQHLRSDKAYLDSILDVVDLNIKLDEEQGVDT